MFERGGKMKIKSLLFIGCYLSLVVLLLSGCGGGGPGSPGSHGTENTGVVLDATIIPNYDGNNTSNVDAAQDVCDPGPPPKYEVFKDHGATVTINAKLLNPNAKFTAGNIYIEKYTVEFRRSTDSIGSPPIEKVIDGTEGMPVVIVPPTGTGTVSVTTTVIFVDLIRKMKYWDDVTSGQFTSISGAGLNNYTAIYTFKGKNEFGDSFSFTAQTGFEIGDFDNCQ
jgi:hypothetical protein